MISWEEISKTIDEKITTETKVPKTNGKTRQVTKKVGSRIYIRTGMKIIKEKYTTKEILRYAYETIQRGEVFTSMGLKSKYPKEYSQGGCIFSMTGGILETLGIAKYVSRVGYVARI